MAWKNLLECIYPVGSIYFSTTNISPASTIGGSWTQITNKVIRASTSFSSGGTDSETIDFNHNHAMTLNRANSLGDWAFLENQNGIGYHQGDAAVQTKAVLTSTSEVMGSMQNMNGPAAIYGGNNGIPLGEKTISHLPAYQNLFCWYRTA